jgi:hypothetical protein
MPPCHININIALHNIKITTLGYTTTLLPYPLPSLQSNSTVIMLRCCIVCRTEASPEKYCAVCKSALYCSKACQKKDWRKHKRICKLLNVGHGDMQFRTDAHTSLSIDCKEVCDRRERTLDENGRRFFKLFQESTFEESQAAARKMKNYAKRQAKHNQLFLLFYSLHILLRSDSKMLSWPNCPLLVMLQVVDPNVLTGDKNTSVQDTPLYVLAGLADHSDYCTHENQLILAKHLIEHGADVNATSSSRTPLHMACNGRNVTNLDFIQLLLKEGADPNIQDHGGMTPLLFTNPGAPGAAKFLLNWPTTDASITTQDEESFLASARSIIKCYSDRIALPGREVKHQLLLQHWREIEEMLVRRGARDTGNAVFV